MLINPGNAETPEQLNRSGSLATMAEHIVSRHHSFMRKELAIIAELLVKAGKSNPGEDLETAEDFLSGLSRDMLEHLHKEENQLFNRLGDVEKGQAPRDLEYVIRELEEEHRHTGEALARMQMPMSEVLLPDIEGGAVGEIREHLRRIERDLRTHIHIEAAVLFPRIRSCFERTGASQS